MLKRLKTYHLILTLQTILGIVFIFSGITKVIDLNKFAEALVNFKLLNDNLINIVKYTLPLIEITLGIFIIFNYTQIFKLQIVLFLFTFLYKK